MNLLVDLNLLVRRCGRLALLTAALVPLAAAIVDAADDQTFVKTTFTYKVVDGLDIRADLHRADDDDLRPLVVWIHGGALIMGNREGRQHGLWPREVSGWDPRSEAKKFLPFMPVRNVTADFPPTLLLHGTKDTDVPYEQSTRMAVQLARHGVEYWLIPIQGGEHGLGGGAPGRIGAAYRAALDFVNRHMDDED